MHDTPALHAVGEWRSTVMEEGHGALVQGRHVYRGRIFSVEADTVRLPHGAESLMEVVRHVGSVVLLAMPDPAHVILVRQYRYAVDRWLWELPAGCIEPGEEPEKAAVRECMEEIGLVPRRVERLGSFYPTPGYSDEAMIVYRLTDLTEPTAADGSSRQDADEHLRVKVFPIEEARRLLTSGESLDLKTAWALLLP
jgi:ADP-ribose pyrophosphatase